MKRLVCIASVCAMLLGAAACKKPAPAPTPTPSPAPAPVVEQVERGPYPWWSEHAAFSAFPVYEYEGCVVPEGYENGPTDQTRTAGCYQFMLYSVTKENYLAYVQTIIASGLPLYNEFEGLVSEVQVEQEKDEGSAAFISGAYMLRVLFDARNNRLSLQVYLQ